MGDEESCLQFSKTDFGKKDAIRRHLRTIAAISDNAKKNFQVKCTFREMISATAWTAFQSYLVEK